jgi:threonine/homoserine/homoserine lactone efflux protein
MIEQYTTGVLLAYGVFMIGIFTPGPNILAIVGTSMSTGRTEGKSLAFGIATGSLAWGSLTLFGLTALITLYASVMTALKIAGAFYLLWLAFKAFRSALSTKDLKLKTIVVKGGSWSYYRRGVIIQMTNAKAALVWIAIMSLAMDGQAPIWVGGMVVLGTAIISFAGHWAYAVAFSTAPVVAAYGRTRRWVEGALGAYFCFASYKLITYKSS